MTTDQWFAIFTLSLTAAFTALLLSFAWRAIRIWRASKKKKWDETKLLFHHNNEYFTPDWEREIRKIGMRYSDQIGNEQARCNQIIHDLKREWADENLELRNRRSKEEGGADE